MPLPGSEPSKLYRDLRINLSRGPEEKLNGTYALFEQLNRGPETSSTGLTHKGLSNAFVFGQWGCLG